MHAGHAMARHVACASSGAASRSLITIGRLMALSKSPGTAAASEHQAGQPRPGSSNFTTLEAAPQQRARRLGKPGRACAHHGQQGGRASAQRVADNAQPEAGGLGERCLQRLHCLLQYPPRCGQHAEMAACRRTDVSPPALHRHCPCSGHVAGLGGPGPVAEHHAILINHMVRLAGARQAREHVLRNTARCQQTHRILVELFGQAGRQPTLTEFVPRMASTMQPSWRSRAIT